MTRFGLIGTCLFSFALVSPATAASEGLYRIHRLYQAHDKLALGSIPVPGPGTRSAWSGPYDDGNYPGTHDDWMRLAPSAHGG
jgi:hypothetical protein